MSPGAHDLSIDEGIDSEDESDNEHYDSESDNGKVFFHFCELVLIKFVDIELVMVILEIQLYSPVYIQ